LRTGASPTTWRIARFIDSGVAAAWYADIAAAVFG